MRTFPTPLLISAAALAVVSCLLASPPAQAQGAPNAQVRYNGFASATPPTGADDRVEQRFDSRNTAPIAAASSGPVTAESFGTLAPLASVTARSFVADLLPGFNLGVGSAQITMSYSVVWTPEADQYEAALALAQSGGSFGQVEGQATAQAEGRASARARLRAESGGFGVDAGRVRDQVLLECGTLGGIAPEAGCGGRRAILNLYFEPLPNSPSFVSSISMFASVETGGASPDPAVVAGNAFAFVDPLITLDAQWAGELVVGGGAVANAIPEPATTWMLMGGLALLSVWLFKNQPSNTRPNRKQRHSSAGAVRS